ncbi:hypothetical protein K1719_028755 [Acacia pycnantha]|nr:hypothetical protein K1719_028755 [Acacia pycnantha]
MADLRTMLRRLPLGYRFCPTDQQLIAYYLRHKLMARVPSIYNTIPEFDVCQYEPWELAAKAASAFPEMEQYDSECYFFHSCDYRTRFKRKTPHGFWKVTGKDKLIKDRNSKNVIGKKRFLVYHKKKRKGAPHAIATNWVIHEYHDDTFPQKQRTFVVCRLKKKYEKKTKKNQRKSISPEMESNNHTDIPAEHYLSEQDSYSSMIEELYYQPGEGLSIAFEVGSGMDEQG